MKNIKFVLPDAVCDVLACLHAAGFEAYIVGGSVRDAVMGVVPHDFDITTSALPQETVQIFTEKGYKVIETGLKHGTVTVLCEHEPVEITTFRVDGAYADARHPENVRFTAKLSEDLKRRDFTVNALVYAPESGVIDLFDGLSDIQNKTLRCIGNPNERFSEDALRILRALRFSAKLDFSIEPETAEAAVALRGLLERISAERITDELEKMFETAYPARLYSVLCEFRPILSQIFPETAFVSESEYIALCDITSRLPSGACVQAFKDLRFAYFIAVSGFPDALLKRLRVPTAFAKRVKALAEILPLAGTACDRVGTRKLLARFGRDVCNDAAAVWTATDENTDFSQFLEICASDCVSLASLAINGTDLADIGLSGKAVGAALNAALQAVMEEKVQNRREELLEYIKNTVS